MANPPKDRSELLRDKAKYKAGQVTLDDLCKKYQHTKSSIKTLLSRAEQLQKRWEDYKMREGESSRQPGKGKKPLKPVKPIEPSEPKKPRQPVKVHWEISRDLLKRVKHKAIDQNKATVQVVREVLERYISTSPFLQKARLRG